MKSIRVIVASFFVTVASFAGLLTLPINTQTVRADTTDYYFTTQAVSSKPGANVYGPWKIVHVGVGGPGNSMTATVSSSQTVTISSSYGVSYKDINAVVGVTIGSSKTFTSSYTKAIPKAGVKYNIQARPVYTTKIVKFVTKGHPVSYPGPSYVAETRYGTVKIFSYYEYK